MLVVELIETSFGCVTFHEEKWNNQPTKRFFDHNYISAGVVLDFNHVMGEGRERKRTMERVRENEDFRVGEDDDDGDDIYLYRQGENNSRATLPNFKCINSFWVFF